MTEPDPCPFERAELLTDEAQEIELDVDLLADCEDVSDERPLV